MILIVILVCLDKSPQISNLLVFVLIKIVTALPARSQLTQVIVETFLRDAYLFSRILQTQPLMIEILVVVTDVKATPLGHFLNHILYRTLFSTFRFKIVSGGITLGKWASFTPIVLGCHLPEFLIVFIVLLKALFLMISDMILDRVRIRNFFIVPICAHICQTPLKLDSQTVCIVDHL